MALEGPVHRGIADADAVVALQVPGDVDGPEVVGPPQVEDLLDAGAVAFGCACAQGFLLTSPA
jgi:hypothetical protein